MKYILSRVRRCVDDYQMIQDGETIAVGVSGGKDSLLTLAALADLRRFYPKHFDLVAMTMDSGTPGQDLSPLGDFCKQLDVPFHLFRVPVYEIVFDIRKEKNPCSLCAKLRRGALHSEMKKLGIGKIALGHHFDDAVETMVLNLIFEGRVGCFQPVTYLDRMDVTQIRPLLYVHEQDVKRAVQRLELPVCKNPCPANGFTRREEIKQLLADMEARHPDIKQKIFGAMQRYPLPGWDAAEEGKQ